MLSKCRNVLRVELSPERAGKLATLLGLCSSSENTVNFYTYIESHAALLGSKHPQPGQAPEEKTLSGHFL
jgi:hypothetical protein